VCVNIKHDVGDSQNTSNYLFATAGVQDGNNYMFRPFPFALIRLYIPSFKSIYNKLTRLCFMIKHILVSLLYILLKLGIYNLMMATGKGRNM